MAAKLSREIAAKEEQLELGIGEINLKVQVLQLELADLSTNCPGRMAGTLSPDS